MIIKEEYKSKCNDEEICSICKINTGISRKQPVEERYGYIIGVGQLCYNCYQDLKEGKV